MLKMSKDPKVRKEFYDGHMLHSGDKNMQVGTCLLHAAMKQRYSRWLQKQTEDLKVVLVACCTNRGADTAKCIQELAPAFEVANNAAELKEEERTEDMAAKAIALTLATAYPRLDNAYLTTEAEMELTIFQKVCPTVENCAGSTVFDGIRESPDAEEDDDEESDEL